MKPFDELELAPMSSDGMLYSQATDEYLDDPDEYLQMLFDNGGELRTVWSLQLETTVPRYATIFDLAEHDLDLLPENHESHPWIREVIECAKKLNLALEKMPALCWERSGKRWDGEWI